MLTHLKIQNLILVDLADIHFGSGLNILTGETGAGKSAILSAIRLITGERAESGLIGKNGDIAVVEALVNSLSIRREIHKSGKSRCFIDDALVSLSSLRETVGSTLELISQSSSGLLSSIEEQRNLLDDFAETQEIVKLLAISFTEEQQMGKKLESLEISKETRTRDLAWAQSDLALIDETNWKSEEDTTLTQEHHLLTHSQELLEKMGSISGLLNELPIKKVISLLDGCKRLDPHLDTIAGNLKSAGLEIEEAQREINSYISRLDADPRRLVAVEERISSIEQIKRRFGKTFEKVAEKRKELLQQIDCLNHLDQEVDSLKISILQKSQETKNFAKQLSLERKKSAKIFGEKILTELRTLNLPHAQFEIEVKEGLISAHGSDVIRFLFSANEGHPPIPVEECASGGELSRLLLAMKTTCAVKSSCLIFDEIDSNVGGQTASILGEKLKTIAEKRQIICVTHFVQVARCANVHFVVKKEGKNGGTVTSISKLELFLEKTQEYQRMLGSCPTFS